MDVPAGLNIMDAPIANDYSTQIMVNETHGQIYAAKLNLRLALDMDDVVTATSFSDKWLSLVADNAMLQGCAGKPKLTYGPAPVMNPFARPANQVSFSTAHDLSLPPLLQGSWNTQDLFPQPEVPSMDFTFGADLGIPRGNFHSIADERSSSATLNPQTCNTARILAPGVKAMPRSMRVQRMLNELPRLATDGADQTDDDPFGDQHMMSTTSVQSFVHRSKRPLEHDTSSSSADQPPLKKVRRSLTDLGCVNPDDKGKTEGDFILSSTPICASELPSRQLTPVGDLELLAFASDIPEGSDSQVSASQSDSHEHTGSADDVFDHGTSGNCWDGETTNPLDSDHAYALFTLEAQSLDDLESGKSASDKLLTSVQGSEKESPAPPPLRPCRPTDDFLPQAAIQPSTPELEAEYIRLLEDDSIVPLHFNDDIMTDSVAYEDQPSTPELEAEYIRLLEDDSIIPLHFSDVIMTDSIAHEDLHANDDIQTTITPFVPQPTPSPLLFSRASSSSSTSTELLDCLSMTGVASETSSSLADSPVDDEAGQKIADTCLFDDECTCRGNLWLCNSLE